MRLAKHPIAFPNKSDKRIKQERECKNLLYDEKLILKSHFGVILLPDATSYGNNKWALSGPTKFKHFRPEQTTSRGRATQQYQSPDNRKGK